jgi:hypothetical protein
MGTRRRFATLSVRLIRRDRNELEKGRALRRGDSKKEDGDDEHGDGHKKPYAHLPETDICESRSRILCVSARGRSIAFSACNGSIEVYGIVIKRVFSSLQPDSGVLTSFRLSREAFPRSSCTAACIQVRARLRNCLRFSCVSASFRPRQTLICIDLEFVGFRHRDSSYSPRRERDWSLSHQHPSRCR